MQPDEEAGPNDFHNEFCKVCNDGGELLCCESCPSAYHTFCLNPPLKDVPEEEWVCPRCSAQPLKAKVQKILTWRWVDPNDPEKTDDESGENKSETNNENKASQMTKDEVRRTIKCLKPVREFFVKYQHMSYWHCDWISELQLDVFHNFLYKSYFRKNDMEEPPNLDLETYDAKKRQLAKQQQELQEQEEEVGELVDGEEINAGTGKKRPEKEKKLYKDPVLEKKYFKYGIRPEWMEVHRVICHKQSRDGRYMYLVKWKDLGYDQCAWEYEEEEGFEIPDLKEAIEAYWKLRSSAELTAAVSNSSNSSNKKSKKKTKRHHHRSDEDGSPLPDKPVTDLKKKYEKQPDFIDETGMELHPYQLEGINWLRFSFANRVDTILAGKNQ